VLLPATYFSALLALIGAVACFSFWPNQYKSAEARWRFELFALDFGIGALILGAVAAFTIGTFGPDMSFNDRLLIAGQSAALWVVGTGAICAFGYLLLLVSTSLLGMAAAFPISFGTTALLIGSSHFHLLKAVPAAAGLALFAFTVASAAVASRSLRSGPRRASWGKGLGLAIAAGIPFAVVQWMLRHTSDPEFGPGPYAIALLFPVGFLLVTPAYNFFFMHIKLVGNPIGFASYKVGGWRFHLPGIVAGAVWGLGLLLLMLALSLSSEHALPSSLVFCLPLLSIPVCVLLALFYWREYANSPRSARMLLILCALGFAVGSVCLGLSYID